MTLTVDAAAVLAYTRAVGDANPAYPQAEDDVEGKVAPPSFAAVYALGAGSGSLRKAGIAPQRLIHGEQEFTWNRLLRIGERLTARGRIADYQRKRQLEFLVAESEVTDEAGERVCLSRATILVLPEGGR